MKRTVIVMEEKAVERGFLPRYWRGRRGMRDRGGGAKMPETVGGERCGEAQHTILSWNSPGGSHPGGWIKKLKMPFRRSGFWDSGILGCACGGFGPDAGRIGALVHGSSMTGA